MGVLLDKEPPKEEKTGPLTLLLEKYKSVVVITSMKVSGENDEVLEFEFDHEIDAPEGEVADEVGRVIMEKLSERLGIEEDQMQAGV